MSLRCSPPCASRTTSLKTATQDTSGPPCARKYHIVLVRSASRGSELGQERTSRELALARHAASGHLTVIMPHQQQWRQAREWTGSGSSDSETSSDEEELMSSSPEPSLAAAPRGGGGRLRSSQRDSKLTIAVLSAHHALDGSPVLPLVSLTGDTMDRSESPSYKAKESDRERQYTSAGTVDWQLVCLSMNQLKAVGLLDTPARRVKLLRSESQVLAMSLGKRI